MPGQNIFGPLEPLEADQRYGRQMGMSILPDSITESECLGPRCMFDGCRAAKPRQTNERIGIPKLLRMRALDNGPSFLGNIDGVIGVSKLGPVLAAAQTLIDFVNGSRGDRLCRQVAKSMADFRFDVG